MTGDLTTLDRVKQWLFPPDQWGSETSDSLFRALIAGASSFIRNLLNRDFGYAEFTEVYDGTGSPVLFLRQAPVGRVISVDLGDGIARTNPEGGTPTFLVEDNRSAGTRQRLILRGYTFPRGLSNIVVVYEAGWKATAAYTIAAGSPFLPEKMWANDVGVSKDGVEWTKVASDPGVGQYAVDSSGVYSFNEADDGETVLIAYGYVPDEIELACRQMVGDQYKAKDRIGVVSQSVGGQETVSYSQRDVSKFVESLLRPYRRVTPI